MASAQGAAPRFSPKGAGVIVFVGYAIYQMYKSYTTPEIDFFGPISRSLEIYATYGMGKWEPGDMGAPGVMGEPGAPPPSYSSSNESNE